jgi:hypothetical protein
MPMNSAPVSSGSEQSYRFDSAAQCTGELSNNSDSKTEWRRLPCKPEPPNRITDAFPSELTFPGMGNLVGKSPAMQEVFSTIRKVAPILVPVLIAGQSAVPTNTRLATRCREACAERCWARTRYHSSRSAILRDLHTVILSRTKSSYE